MRKGREAREAVEGRGEKRKRQEIAKINKGRKE